MLLAIFARKKYKPIAHKIRAIETELPSQFCIIRDIKGDLLESLPHLNPRPPKFEPTSHHMTKHRDQFEEVHTGDFLLPERCKLIHHFMCLQNSTFAWTDQECGNFWEDFLPLSNIPCTQTSLVSPAVIGHTLTQGVTLSLHDYLCTQQYPTIILHTIITVVSSEPCCSESHHEIPFYMLRNCLFTLK